MATSISINKLNDAELICAFKAGNDAAFTALMVRYQDFVTRTLMAKTHDYQVAEDLTQMTFISIYESIKNGSYKESNQFKGWLSLIANNKFRDYYRKEVTRAETSLCEAATGDDDEGGFDFEDLNESELKEEQLQKLEACINLLPEKQREIIKLRLQEKSYLEIVAELGVNQNSALSRNFNAMKNLKKLFLQCA